MVNLTRIYTRTGDDGTTALGDFSRTSKTDPRLVAYADVDEANSTIGVALAADASPGAGHLAAEVVTLLRRVQNDLFDVGADLCTPLTDVAPERPPLRVTDDYVARLEGACDRWNAELAPLRSFVLPGGTPAAAHLHVARTVTRRAERSVWAALAHHGSTGAGGVNPLTATYLNRLSDLLFILCRHANREAGDVLWVPGGAPEAAAESSEAGRDDVTG
jgi:cob(I)alamin adenosyltransferase